MDGNIPNRTSGRGRGNTAAAEPPSVRQSWTGRIIIVVLVVCIVVALVNAATKDYKVRDACSRNCCHTRNASFRAVRTAFIL